MKIEHYQQAITPHLMSLLLMADPDEETIATYLSNSSILLAYDENRPVAIAVITFENDVAELKNIAVEESHQGKGIAKSLIFKAQDYARENGALSILVGTGNSSLSQLALYQKCGFKMQGIKQGYFSKYPEPIFENGIQCTDMVILSAKL